MTAAIETLEGRQLLTVAVPASPTVRVVEHESLGVFQNLPDPGIMDEFFVDPATHLPVLGSLGEVYQGQDTVNVNGAFGSEGTFQGLAIANIGAQPLKILSIKLPAGGWARLVDTSTGKPITAASLAGRTIAAATVTPAATPDDVDRYTYDRLPVHVQLDSDHAPGDYAGVIEIDTNDPATPAFKLRVTATILQAGQAAPLAGSVTSPGGATTGAGHLADESTIDYNGRYIYQSERDAYYFDLAAPASAADIGFDAPSVDGGTRWMVYRLFRDANADRKIDLTERANILFDSGQVPLNGGHDASHPAQPLAAGRYVLEIDPDGGPSFTADYSMTVKATAVATGRAAVTQSGATIADGAAAASFGAAGVGATGPTRTFRLTNIGAGPLTVSSVRIVKPGFTLLTGNPPGPIAPGGHFDIRVQMLTGSAGAKSARLAIAADDPALGASGTYDVLLSGQVTGATPGNKPPVVGALARSAKTVRRGGALTLTATGVTDPDGAVAVVEFYRDIDKDGVADASELLGVDAPKKGFKFAVATKKLPLGANTFLARARDDQGKTGPVKSITVTVKKALAVATPAARMPAVVMAASPFAIGAWAVRDEAVWA